MPVENSVDVVSTLISAGPLGAIIVALGIAYWRQSLALKAAMDARVTDAQRVASQLLELNDKWHGAVGDLTIAVKELRVFLQGRHGGGE